MEPIVNRDPGDENPELDSLDISDEEEFDNPCVEIWVELDDKQ